MEWNGQVNHSERGVLPSSKETSVVSKKLSFKEELYSITRDSATPGSRLMSFCTAFGVSHLSDP